MLRGMPELSPAQREALGALLNAAPFAGVVRDLGRRFGERGHELYLVGGTVRDALLDRASPDVDLTTDATPDQILAVVRARRWSDGVWLDRKSTRLNSSHTVISYAVFCLKKKNQ